ncbi:kinesin-like protein KIN-13B [Elaeis guineensis]|uniref:kinesin-like protein KIN-13B n=1 Tax=Elaeis guineensis var. tenera TaxID=51953 RepID=UPI003C6DA298
MQIPGKRLFPEIDPDLLKELLLDNSELPTVVVGIADYDDEGPLQVRNDPALVLVQEEGWVRHYLQQASFAILKAEDKANSSNIDGLSLVLHGGPKLLDTMQRRCHRDKGDKKFLQREKDEVLAVNQSDASWIRACLRGVFSLALHSSPSIILLEESKKEEDIITIEQNLNSLTVHETKLKVDLTEYVEKHEFVFDAVLDEDVSNDEVYRETVEPIVPAIFQRTKATCFAYGQTGNGKTYTMQPLPLKASQDILRLMHHTYRNQGFQLFVSFFEIYGGKLFDLLNDRRKLCMREDGKQQVCIVGLQEFRVSHVDTIKELIEKGNATRSTGTTGANEESSRSHAILQLAIKKSVDGSESKPARVIGKLSFIDLAGSERGADTTDNDKQTRIEGAEINKSLLALKQCIRALDNDQTHIPFRGSKLTEVLRDSFIGDSRTVMISCISPNSGSCEHTLNTLRYADRVKSLSKGSNKKDLSSVTNLRDSTAAPLSSALSAFSSPEDHALSGREERTFASSYASYFREQTKVSTAVEDYDYSEEAYEQNKPSWKKGKADAYSASPLEDRVRRAASRTKWKNVPEVDANDLHSDDDLNALLKEMKLLDEADQPGNQLDEYVSRLNAILSQKEAGIVKLQACLAHFQRRLTEHNVLVSSLGP